MRREHVGLAVAIDICNADAVAVLLSPAQVVDPRLVLAEVNPEDTGAVVMRQRQIWLAVAIDIGEGATFGIVTVGDLFRLPHGPGRGRLCAWIVIDPDAVRDPAGGDQIGQAIVVHVHDPLAAIGDEFIVNADRAELVPLPLAAVGARIFIPVSAAEQVREAVSVHVQQRDAFRMIVAETVREKSDARLAAGSVAGMLHTELGGVRRDPVRGPAREQAEAKRARAQRA